MTLFWICANVPLYCGFRIKTELQSVSFYMYIYCNTLYIYYIYIYNCNYWWYLASISGDFQKYLLQYQWITGDIYRNYWTFWSFNVSFLSLSFCIGDRCRGESWRPKNPGRLVQVVNGRIRFGWRSDCFSVKLYLVIWILSGYNGVLWEYYGIYFINVCNWMGGSTGYEHV